MRWWFWALLIAGGLLPLPVVLFVARKQLGPRVGTRRFLAVLPFFIGTWIMVLGAFVLIPRAWRTDTFATFQLLLALIIWLSLLYAWWKRRQAGAVLLDLGRPRRSRWPLIISITASTLISVVFVLEAAAGEADIEDIARILFFSTLPGMDVFLLNARMQVRERGLLLSGSVLPWERIKAYTWEQNKPNVLTLRVQTRVLSVRKASMPIPPAFRDQVDALLAHHVSASAVLQPADR